MANCKVTVNHNLCVGSQLCVAFLPAVFSLNDDGQSEAKVNGDVSEIELVQTAEQCPQCAIRVEIIETGEVLFPPPELER